MQIDHLYLHRIPPQVSRCPKGLPNCARRGDHLRGAPLARALAVRRQADPGVARIPGLRHGVRMRRVLPVVCKRDRNEL